MESGSAGFEGAPPVVTQGEAPDKADMLARLQTQAGLAGIKIEYDDLAKPGKGYFGNPEKYLGDFTDLPPGVIVGFPSRYPTHFVEGIGHVMDDQLVADAAFAVLKANASKHGYDEQAYTKNDMKYDSNIVAGVQFGPFPPGMQNDPPDPEWGNDNPNDEVRIAYWWGNSNLYWPCTRKEFKDALAVLKGERYTGTPIVTNAKFADERLVGIHTADVAPLPFTGVATIDPDGTPHYVTRPPEQEIYTRMWNEPAYRNVAPGEEVAQIFLEQARPRKGAKVIDMGCGTGRGALMLAVLGSLDVTMLDFTTNSLDADIVPMLTTQAHVLRFQQHDLTKPLPLSAEYGFCTDVMEHIPPQDVDRVLNNCLTAAQHCFFQIATEPDVMGAKIGLPLHLSVHDYGWWLNKFNERECTIHWSQERQGSCMFYVTAWQTGQAVVDYGRLNTTDEQVKANVKANIWHGCEGKDAKGDAIVSMQTWKQVTPHQNNDYEAIIVGGGASLSEHVEEIRQRRKDGARLIALNGAFNWCLAHQIVPSAVVVVDARAFNARFTHPEPELLTFLESDPVAKLQYDQIKYLIASQCDPTVLQGLPQEYTYLWHTSTEMIQEELTARYSEWYGVRGGTTVLLRAIPLLRLLGFTNFSLYGCDSCVAVYKDGEEMKQVHHAYSQPENSDEPLITVTVNSNGVPAGRQFLCHGWMIAQAQGFIDTIRVFGHDIEIEVKTGGLLAFILEHGAAEFDRQVFL